MGEILVAFDREDLNQLEQLLIDVTYGTDEPEEINWLKYDMDRLFNCLTAIENAGSSGSTVYVHADPSASWNLPK